MYQYNCCCQTSSCFSFVCLFVCLFVVVVEVVVVFIYFFFFLRNILAEFQWNKNILPFGSVGFQTLEFLLPFRVVFLVLTGSMSRSCSTGSSRFWTSFTNLAWICWDKGHFSFNENAGLNFACPTERYIPVAQTKPKPPRVCLWKQDSEDQYCGQQFCEMGKENLDQPTEPTEMIGPANYPGPRST